MTLSSPQNKAEPVSRTSNGHEAILVEEAFVSVNHWHHGGCGVGHGIDACCERELASNLNHALRLCSPPLMRLVAIYLPGNEKHPMRSHQAPQCIQCSPIMIITSSHSIPSLSQLLAQRTEWRLRILRLLRIKHPSAIRLVGLHAPIRHLLDQLIKHRQRLRS